MRTIRSGSEETVLAAFKEDHRRIDLLLEEALAASGDPERARKAIAQLAGDLRRHIRAEDDVLFHAFEEHTGMRDAGPTAMMRREHRLIEHRLELLATAVEGSAAGAVDSQLRALRALLLDHDHREEAVLFPACDRLIHPLEASAAIGALRKR